MSAARHVSPGQLKMFMSPNDLKAEGFEPNPNEVYPEDTGSRTKASVDVMMERKLRESQGGRGGRERVVGGATYGLPHRDTLYDKIERDGVQKPIHLSHTWQESGFEDPVNRPVIGQGHHRVASETDIDPDRLMPVIHHGNLFGAVIEDYDSASPDAPVRSVVESLSRPNVPWHS